MKAITMNVMGPGIKKYLLHEWGDYVPENKKILRVMKRM